MIQKTNSIEQKIIPILKKHGISRAGLFGSYVRNEHQEHSDVDILVECGKPLSLLEFVRIKLDLEYSLNKKVDLVEYQAIKSRIKDRILTEEVRLYG